MGARWLIGVDEAGRGPLAGPAAVGAVMVTRDFDWNLVKGAKDSKQMTALARERMFEHMRSLKGEGTLRFVVTFSSAAAIGRSGIVPAIHSAVARGLIKLDARPSECEIRLDGSLSAPEEFENQTTIIRGDELETIISLASIVAKVQRDRLMIRLAKEHPEYGFDIHMGYGTLKHRTAIKKNGFCKLHRATFCRNLLSGLNTV